MGGGAASPSKKTKRKRKKKMTPLQIKSRPAKATSTRNTEIPFSDATLEEELAQFRKAVLIMNGILAGLHGAFVVLLCGVAFFTKFYTFPGTSLFLFLGAHGMSLLGALQLNMTLLVPAWIYFVVMWCLWIGYPYPLGLVVYSVVIGVQGKFMYRVRQKQLRQVAEQYDLIVRTQPSYSDDQDVGPVV